MLYVELPDREGKANYVGFGVDIESLSEYQLETLKRNEIEGILKVNIETSMDGVRIYAEKAGKIKLSQILERKKFDILDFLKLSIMILKTAELGESLLIKRDGIVLDDNFILIDEFKNPYLFILPLKNSDKSFEVSFHGFLQRLLLKTEIDGVDENIQDYKAIFHKLQDKNFDELDFIKFAEEMLLTRKLFKKTSIEEKDVMDEFYSNRVNTKEKFGKSINSFNKNINSFNKNINSEFKKLIFESKIIEYTVLIGWCGFLALALFLGMGIFEAAGGSLIFIIVLFLAKRTIGNNQPHLELNDKEWAEEIGKDSETDDKMNDGINDEIDVKEMKTFEKPFILDYFSDTMLIEDMKRPFIALLEDSEGRILDEVDQDKHFIESGIFIGRNKDLVNMHFTDREIGKVHSEIWKESSKIYIKDLNSKNGTWLNGIRLKIDEPMELSDGDVIIFAMRKCIFRDI